MTDKVLVILQARMSSSRFPGKVLVEINNQPIILWQVRRVLNAKHVNKIVVATSTNSSDNVLVEKLKSQGVIVHRGNLLNVLERYVEVAKAYPEFNTIVRLTADCPLVMPEIIDHMLAEFKESKIDYLSNVNPPTFPDGLDVEIFRRKTLMDLNELMLQADEKEHVTLGIRNRPQQFKIMNFSQRKDLSFQHWTVDYPKDIDFVKQVYSRFQGRESSFSYLDVLSDFVPEYSDVPTYVLDWVAHPDQNLRNE